jgi:hypothetical protein
MIRKSAILIIIASAALMAIWKFYVGAVAYDPLDERTVKHARIKETPMAKSAYAPAWDRNISERNLFSPSRTYREPKPVSAKALSEPPRRPDLVLKGIVLDRYGDFIAYLEINQAKAVPLRKGDKVEEIEVADISEKRVVLKWNAETITMSIEKVKTLPGTPRAGR